MEKKSIQVTISGRAYTLVGEEDEARLRAVAAHVDKTVLSVWEANPSLSTVDAAILGAVNVCGELFKARDDVERLRLTVEELQKEKKRSPQGADAKGKKHADP